VHRDIKPGNIMWLPRQNRWTLIDFGCAARTGDCAQLGFTIAYAAPEVIQAFQGGVKRIVVTEALDAWSLGVLAIEVFTGAPAFDRLASLDDVRISPSGIRRIVFYRAEMQRKGKIRNCTITD
jgi:serine/threonine protein kinase